MLDKGIKAKKKIRITGKQLVTKIKMFAVSGLGTPIKDQDKYIYGAWELGY